jgi:hypothetical protein
MTLAGVVAQEELLESLRSWQPVRCKERFSEETGGRQPLGSPTISAQYLPSPITMKTTGGRSRSLYVESRL